MKEIIIYNEQTHSLDNLSEFEKCKNGNVLQVNIPAIFSNYDLEIMSNVILNQMQRLSLVDCPTDDLRKAIKEEQVVLQKLNSKICDLIF